MLAVATMTRAVKAVTTFRGRDPRDFTLCAFGGNGPLTGVEIARALQMRHVLIPPAPGVFSALGLLFSDTEHEVVRTLMLRGADVGADALEAAFAGVEGRGDREPRGHRRSDGHRHPLRRRAVRGSGVRARRSRPARPRRRRASSSPTSSPST